MMLKIQTVETGDTFGGPQDECARHFREWARSQGIEFSDDEPLGAVFTRWMIARTVALTPDESRDSAQARNAPTVGVPLEDLREVQAKAREIGERIE